MPEIKSNLANLQRHSRQKYTLVPLFSGELSTFERIILSKLWNNLKGRLKLFEYNRANIFLYIPNNNQGLKITKNKKTQQPNYFLIE